jgi:hypothetical protein
MEVRFGIAQPDEVKVTATITMPLKRWLELREALPHKHPWYDLSIQISALAADARKTFYPQKDEGDDG